MTKALITVIKQTTEEQIDFSKDSNSSLRKTPYQPKLSGLQHNQPTPCMHYLILPKSQELCMVYAVLIQSMATAAQKLFTTKPVLGAKISYYYHPHY